MSNRLVFIGVLIGSILAGLSPVDAQPLNLPLGLRGQAAIIPEDNPITGEKVALGKQLFFDVRWSKGKTVSCSSCHNPARAWTDGRQLSLDHAGRLTRRRSPTIINRAFGQLQGWAGQGKSIELLLYNLPFTSPETIVQNLGSVQGYQARFQHVFGTAVTADGVAKAIAAYVRTILSGNSPYDRFRAGDRTALSPTAQRGLALFEGKARCVQCHSGFNLTDEGYHNLGVGINAERPDLGRYEVTKRTVNRGAFKAPTLRDVALRTPYMHDGSLRTLGEVIEFYNRGGIANPWQSREKRMLYLTAEEQGDLLTFLESLTGEVSADVVAPPVLPE